MSSAPGAGPRAGQLIVLEGTDGSGTTTQAQLLLSELTRRGLDCVVTREPTPGPVGKLLRSALGHSLLDSDGVTPIGLDFRTLALLFAADRCDHNQRVIRPALARGAVVISDRYTLSSLLYQSLTGPTGHDWIPWLQQINAQALPADLVLVLDVDATTAKQRRQARGGPEELFEYDSLQAKLAQAYVAVSPELCTGSALVHLDGSLPPTDVAQQVLASVLAFLGKAEN